MKWLGMILLLIITEKGFGLCLQGSERKAFTEILTKRILNSELGADGIKNRDMEKIVAHVQNRLSFGTYAIPSAKGPSDYPSDIKGASMLANEIARSLQDVTKWGGRWNLKQLQEMQNKEIHRANQFINQRSPFNMVFAPNSMELRELKASQLRQKTKIFKNHKNDPIKFQKYKGAIRARIILSKNYRSGAKAMRIYNAVLAKDIDIGAVLGEFWLNHFNVEAMKTSFRTPDYYRAIKRELCGSFEELVLTTARHPAMLVYLDNFRSRKGNLNQNYARELMELHTLGDNDNSFVDTSNDGGDLDKVAALFSGWTVKVPGMPKLEGKGEYKEFGFLFNHLRHDGTAQTDILKIDSFSVRKGNGTPSDVNRGIKFIKHLSQHKGTKRNICSKLMMRLIGLAPKDLLQSCMKAWDQPMANGKVGNLPAVYQTILTSRSFWSHRSGLPLAKQSQIKNVYSVKTKNPLELVASKYRALGYKKDQLFTFSFFNRIDNDIKKLGFDLTNYITPTGYPESLRMGQIESKKTGFQNYAASPYMLTAFQSVLFRSSPQFKVTGIKVQKTSEKFFGNSNEYLVSASPKELDKALQGIMESMGVPKNHKHVLRQLKEIVRYELSDKHIKNRANSSLLRPISHSILSSKRFLRK